MWLSYCQKSNPKEYTLFKPFDPMGGRCNQIKTKQNYLYILTAEILQA